MAAAAALSENFKPTWSAMRPPFHFFPRGLEGRCRQGRRELASTCLPLTQPPPPPLLPRKAASSSSASSGRIPVKAAAGRALVPASSSHSGPEAASYSHPSLSLWAASSVFTQLGGGEKGSRNLFRRLYFICACAEGASRYDVRIEGGGGHGKADVERKVA